MTTNVYFHATRMRQKRRLEETENNEKKDDCRDNERRKVRRQEIKDDKE
jgi:hypothetical protein